MKKIYKYTIVFAVLFALCTITAFASTIETDNTYTYSIQFNNLTIENADIRFGSVGLQNNYSSDYGGFVTYIFANVDNTNSNYIDFKVLLPLTDETQNLSFSLSEDIYGIINLSSCYIKQGSRNGTITKSGDIYIFRLNNVSTGLPINCRLSFTPTVNDVTNGMEFYFEDSSITPYGTTSQDISYVMQNTDELLTGQQELSEEISQSTQSINSQIEQSFDNQTDTLTNGWNGDNYVADSGKSEDLTTVEDNLDNWTDTSNEIFEQVYYDEVSQNLDEKQDEFQSISMLVDIFEEVHGIKPLLYISLALGFVPTILGVAFNVFKKRG